MPSSIRGRCGGLLFIGLAVMLSASAAAGELDSLYVKFRPLLEHELATREVTCPDDLYKFLFQGVMGPAHATINLEAAQSWLDAEWQELPPPPDTSAVATRSMPLPLLEPLRPDFQLVRLNLLPLRELVVAGVPAAGQEGVCSVARERLAVAFSRTAARWQAERGVLRGLWTLVTADEPLWSPYFAQSALEAFNTEVARKGWPAVHHSEAYRSRWAPHYRVVALDLLPPKWRDDRPSARATSSPDEAGAEP
jgi:hypothetical protein